jgi:Domain of Unknown Function (DUF928)
MEMKSFKSFHFISLSALLVLNNGFSFQLGTVIAVPKTCNPQNITEYDRFMKQGYQASTQRNNKNTALENFNRALKLCPDDSNANKAIENINAYYKNANVMHVTPSGIGAPSNRAQAATRNQNCLDGKELVALIPEQELGLTSMEHPTLLFYIPLTSAPTLKLTLEDNSGKTIYTKTFKTPAKTGLVQFKFSEFKESPSLTPLTTYQWTFSLVCDPQDPSANVTVFGSIQRIKLDPTLFGELKTATPSDRVKLYATNGLWYDTVATLAEARQFNPSDPQLAKSWQELLKSVGL